MVIGSQATDQAAGFKSRFPQGLCAHAENGTVIWNTVNNHLQFQDFVT